MPKEKPKEEEVITEKVQLKAEEFLSPALPTPEKEKLSNLEDDLGFIEVVSSIPSEQPIHPLKRIKLYVSGTTYRLYIYDKENNVWRYTTLT